MFSWIFPLHLFIILLFSFTQQQQQQQHNINEEHHGHLSLIMMINNDSGDHSKALSRTKCSSIAATRFKYLSCCYEFPHFTFNRRPPTSVPGPCCVCAAGACGPPPR